MELKSEWVRRPECDCTAIFVHGLTSSGDRCWRCDNGTYWPELLEMDPKLRMIGIYVYTYQTEISSGSYTLGDIVDDLKERMSVDELYTQKRIIFICHSMGGIVVRKLLVERQRDFENTKIGLFLLASPSLGPNYVNWLVAIAKITGNAQLHCILSLKDNDWLADLDKTFHNLKEERALRIEGKELMEDKPISLSKRWLWFFQPKAVVGVSSAARYFGDPYKVPQSDHFSIAKPGSDKEIQHRLLRKFVIAFLEDKTTVENPKLANGDGLVPGATHNIENVATGASGESVAQKAEAVRFEKVRSYVDTGDYITAISCLLGERAIDQSDIETCIDVVAICQKFGLLERATDYVNQLRRASDWERWLPEERATIDVIALKIASQQYRHEMVVSAYGELCSLLARLGRAGWIPGVLRRAAVAYAVSGNCKAAMGVLERAQGIPEVRRDQHDQITTSIYLAMIRALRCPEAGNMHYGSDLIAAQLGYLRVPVPRVRLQAMPFKSTIQSLFTEAAILSTEERRNPASQIRITIAHLLGPRAHTNPHSEGYAELLSLITSEERRRMFEVAMRSDDAGRSLFQKEYGESFRVYLRACRDIPTIAQPLGVETWCKVREVISELDRKFGARP